MEVIDHCTEKKENSEKYGKRDHIHGQDTGKYQYYFTRHCKAAVEYCAQFWKTMIKKNSNQANEKSVF